jgi:hypothetical protein
MSQILHIFRKDIRHHWPEILLSLALLGVYGWLEPRKWGLEGAGATGDFPLLILLGKALPWLIPIAWCLLIVRVVQGESLVGDRQFWVTRPYQWPKLLASKALLLVVFINVPLFVVDVIVLERSKFNPWPYVPGLLFMQFLLLLSLTIPACAAAVITSNLGQVLLLALGIALYLISVAYLNSVIPNSNFSGSSIGDVAQAIIFWGTCVFIILLQYARRETMRSRIVLCCSAAAIGALVVITPYAFLQAKSYPMPASEDENVARFALDTTAAHEAADIPLPEKQKEIDLQLPLRVSGIAEDYVVQEKRMQVTIQGSDGVLWTSRWTAAYSLLWPEQNKSSINFSVDRKVFERVKSVPVDIHVAIALVQYNETDERTALATSGDFPVARFGTCSIFFKFSTFLNCRSALKTPAYLAKVERAKTTCPPRANGGQASVSPVAVASGGDWNDSSPADMGIDPVSTFSLSFLPAGDWRFEAAPICPGTPVTFYTPAFSRRSRADFDIHGIRLDEYAPKPLVFTR